MRAGSAEHGWVSRCRERKTPQSGVGGERLRRRPATRPSSCRHDLQGLGFAVLAPRTGGVVPRAVGGAPSPDLRGCRRAESEVSRRRPTWPFPPWGLPDPRRRGPAHWPPRPQAHFLSRGRRSPPPAARPQPVPSPSPSDGPAGLRRLLPSRARTGSPRPDEGPGAGLPRCPCPSALRRVTLAPGPRQEGRARAPAGRASGTPRPLDLRAPPGSRRGAPEAGRDLSVDFRVGPSPGNGPAGLNRRGNQPARSPS